MEIGFSIISKCMFVRVAIRKEMGMMRGLKEYNEAECARDRVPQIAVVGDHYLSFRCPTGCDQNTTIQFVGLEVLPGGEEDGVLTFNLSCPKCKKSYHYKIVFGPYTCHTYYGLPWTEQIRAQKNVG
jgi:hypothetical protein